MGAMKLIVPILLAVVGTAVAESVTTAGNAKISAASAYYDRMEGFAYFSGSVRVDDAEYQLYADRAYVFMDETNDLNRIVALGHVAMTNGQKRAYGDKVTYYRHPGVVVLSSTGEKAAELRDVTKDGDQVVRGAKIKFWTATKQVEVLKADIAAPVTGKTGGVLKNVLGK